jgi:hypothetical protein
LRRGLLPGFLLDGFQAVRKEAAVKTIVSLLVGKRREQEERDRCRGGRFAVLWFAVVPSASVRGSFEFCFSLVHWFS